MNTVIIDGLSFALPLFIMAIGGIYSEKSGVTNLALKACRDSARLRALWPRYWWPVISRAILPFLFISPCCSP